MPVFLRPPGEVCGDEREAGMSADFEDPDGNQFSIFGMVARTKLPAKTATKTASTC